MIGLIIMFTLIQFSSSNHLLPVTPQSDMTSLANCIIEVFNSNNLYKKSILIYKTDKNGEETLIDEFFKHGPLPVTIKDLKYAEKNNDLNYESLFTITMFENCEELEKLDLNIIKNDAKYFIIISTYKKSCEDTFQKFGNAVDELDVVIVINNGEEHTFISFIPEIDEITCHLKDTIQPTYSKCIRGVMEAKQIFPVKSTSNMKGCKLRLGIATLFPFAMFENKESHKDYDLLTKVEGSDVAIVKIIAEHLNASLEFRSIFRFEQNPYIHTEFLNFVLNGSLDALAGGLYRVYRDVVDYSGIYQRQGVVWVYTAERENRSWSNFVAKVNGLYVFFLFYILYCVAWNLCSYLDEGRVTLKTTVLSAWGALIGAASLQEAKSLKQRVLNIFYLILCIHLSFYISVHLVSFLTIQRPPQIFKTNEDVIKSGRTAILTRDTKYFIQDPNYVNFANKSEDCDNFEDCQEKTLSHKGVTVVIDGLFYPFQVATSVESEARILRTPENIITVYHEMIIRKKSPIVKSFQRVIGKLYEAGICDKLYIEAIGVLVVDKAEKMNDNMMHNSYSCVTGCSITLAQTAGIFYLWGIGCLLSCIVFVSEIFSKRRRELS